jgi:hypothetical protein
MSEQSLFIKLDENGRPESHPILEQNLADLIEGFDPTNPPKGFVKFVKVPVPELHPYEKYEYLDYEHSPELSEEYGQETWHEVHHIHRMNKEERDEIIKKYKRINPDLSDWVFDENTLSLVPPIPKPEDGKTYYWNVDVKAWQESKPNLYFDEVMDLAKVIGIDLHSASGGKPDVPDEQLMKKLVGMITIGK